MVPIHASQLSHSRHIMRPTRQRHAGRPANPTAELRRAGALALFAASGVQGIDGEMQITHGGPFTPGQQIYQSIQAATERESELFRQILELEEEEWLEEDLLSENFGPLFNQFTFNINVFVNIGALAGYRIPPDFPADPAYMAASGTVTPTAATQRGELPRRWGEFLSPEKVSARTLDFAVSLYSRDAVPADDTPRARRAYADAVGEALDRTFAQTRAVAGGDGTGGADAVEATRELIRQGLRDFVVNGPDTVKNLPGGAYDRLRDYANRGRTFYSSRTAEPVTVPPMIDSRA